MAGVSKIPSGQSFGLSFDDDCDATPTQDIDSGPTTLFGGLVTNAVAAVEYLHLWNQRSPVMGTTPQDCQIPCPASDDFTFFVVEGGRFDIALSYAMTSDKGTAANTSPAVPTDVRLVTQRLIRAVGAVQAISGDTDVGGAQLTTFADKLGIGTIKDEVADSNLRTVKGSAGNIFGLRIDNTANTSAESFLKIYDAAAPTVGTDDPDVIIRAPAGIVITWIFPEGIACVTAVKYAVVTTQGTAGTGDPSNDVEIEVCND